MPCSPKPHAARDGAAPASTAPLTVLEAAALLGQSTAHGARKFRRRLLAADKRCGGKLLVRSGGERAPRYTTTIGLLRRYCHELFDRPSEIDRGVRALRAEFTRGLVAIQEQIDDLREERARDRARIAALEAQLVGKNVRIGGFGVTRTDTNGRLVA